MRNPVQRDTAAYYHDILDAFSRSGCPVCSTLERGADRYLDGVLWELVLDLEIRQELNLSRGYCQKHGWMLVRAGSALGIAILMKSVVEAVLDELASQPVRSEPESALKRVRQNLPGRQKSDAGANLSQAVAPKKPCPACTHMQVVEDHLIHGLVSHLRGPESLVDAYRASDGLCLEHFRKALTRARSAADVLELNRSQQYVWQRLRGELGEFIRKNDHRFRDETFGVERDSWLRALESFSGPAPSGRSSAPRSEAFDDGVR